MITLQGRPRPRRSRPETILEIPNFIGASNLLLDEARIAPNEAATALNLIQVQDGLWQPRWGTAYYGPISPNSSNIDGAAEFVKSDGTTELCIIAGGNFYHAQNGASWVQVTGASFTSGVQCYFMQIGGSLYIANGTDPLTLYNGVTLTQYTSLSAPTGLAGVASSSISGTGFTYYAQVTALNTVGETVGSVEISVNVNKKRDIWSTTTGDQIVWSWNSVVGASRYQLYIADQAGKESLLVATTNTTYTDNNSLTINPFVQPPLSNTTTAPKFISMAVSGNRIWATNDANNMYTVYFSGTGQFIGTFSDFYGGGYINLEKGGRAVPQAVIHYQSGTGSPAATILCKTPEGRGAVWQISIASSTVGSTTFSVPSAQKIVGSSGTEALLSVVADDNNILFANRRGMFQLGPQQNFYGILRTNEMSVKIRNYWRSLTGSAIKGVAAYFYDRKIFISVPTSTSTSGNTATIIWDTERQNWTVYWSFGAKAFLEYTDTSGVTHFMYTPVAGNRMIEISANIQGDLGVVFNSDYQSGRLNLQRYWKDFEKVDKVYVKLGSPRGSIQLQVSGTGRRAGFLTVVSKTIPIQASLTGMGWDLMGSVLMGSTNGTPTTFADSSSPYYVRVRKKFRDIKLRLYTNSIDAMYTLQGFIVIGTPTHQLPPSAWKLT